MNQPSLFAEHIRHLQKNLQQAMTDTCRDVDALLIHSGSLQRFFADDQSPPFRAYGHFLHWLPVNRPDQMLLLIPGQKPVFVQVVADDFWHDQEIETPHWWADQFDILRLTHPRQLKSHLTGTGRLVFLGENTAFAEAMGIPAARHNPAPLLHWLDYQRAYKTDYEIEQLQQAAQLAMAAHESARKRFEEGGSEYDIHMAYLQACHSLDEELPYPSIVALDEKAAILHYQNKRRRAHAQETTGAVLLIDAGCRVHGYCSDITRTWARQNTDPIFHSLIAAVTALQRELIQLAVIGRPFLDLHIAAHEGICEILIDHELCRGTVEQLMYDHVSTLFFPHGLGHLLGIQVHDTGGWLRNSSGDQLHPPPEYPSLRNTRPIEQGQVFTVEPGLYFIRSLLEPECETRRSKYINWPLVEAMMPLGGIRIEDNVVIRADGAEVLGRSA